MKAGVGALGEPAVELVLEVQRVGEARAGSKLVRMNRWVRSRAPF